jgi:exodeoxyribonuclease V beta subunit
VVHKILEELDFSGARLEQNQRLIRDKLAEFGFDTLWLEALLQMAEKVLATPLLEDQPHLLLSRIRPPERLHELAFTLPLDLLTARRLRAVYTVHGGPDVPANFAEAIEKLAFLPVRGAMKGFIDLVFCCQGRFYLLDWKSNYLGGRSGDYGPQQLQAAMARELYLLQSHLYTVALHRYLSVRLPGYRYDTHFGGVFYLFLRGIDPEKGSRYGIYYDLPGEQLIRDLSQCLHAQRS